MSAALTRQALWQAMVEIAEQTHDLVVLAQPQADLDSARKIAAHAADLHVLALAVEVLARTEVTDGP